MNCVWTRVKNVNEKKLKGIKVESGKKEEKKKDRIEMCERRHNDETK